MCHYRAMRLPPQDWQFQMKVWGYAVDAIGDVANITAEQRHPSPCDLAGHPLWDDPSQLANVMLRDRNGPLPTPYWWALPGVVDAMAQQLLEDMYEGSGWTMGA